MHHHHRTTAASYISHQLANLVITFDFDVNKTDAFQVKNCALKHKMFSAGRAPLLPRTGGVTQTAREKLGVRGARHNPPNPRSFFCSQPSCDTVNKFVSETVLPNSFRAPTEAAWGHPRGVDQVKLRVLEASLVQGEG